MRDRQSTDTKRERRGKEEGNNRDIKAQREISNRAVWSRKGSTASARELDKEREGSKTKAKSAQNSSQRSS